MIFKDPAFARSCYTICKDPQGIGKDLARIFVRSLQRFLQSLRSLQGSFKILKDLMRIFEESYKDPFKDLAKIFARILQDPQVFNEDL